MCIVQTVALIVSLALSTSGKRVPYRAMENDYHGNSRYQHQYQHSSPSSRSSSFSVITGLLPPVQCYSCMSESYEPYWVDMSNVYRKQDVMTNRCNDPFFSRGIPYVNCSNICVIMKETISVGGIRVVHAYIRGCLDKILSNYRFNETALLTYNFYRKDHCRELPRSMLIGPQLTGNVYFCSCYGNRCNTAPVSGRYARHLTQQLAYYILDFVSEIFWTSWKSFFWNWRSDQVLACSYGFSVASFWFIHIYKDIFDIKGHCVIFNLYVVNVYWI